MIASELKRVISALESPLILESSVIDDTVYGLKLKGENREWNISLIFPELFPHTLPKAKLLDTDKIGSIPHVNQSGVICVEESDSILLDSSRPKDIIDHFINDTVKLLDKANLKIYQDELMDEIEGYFNFDNKVNSFYVATDKTESVRLKLQRLCNKALQVKPILLVGRDNTLNMEFSNNSKTLRASEQKIIHLALDNPVLPPANQGAITPAYFDELKRNLSSEGLADFKALSKKYTKTKGRYFFILLSMPRASNERTQILLHFSSKEPLLFPSENTDERWDITPYAITRLNKQYLLERGGADRDLTSKKVCIIGCGSVGSEIAAMLAKSGIGELVLVDYDSFDADNIYRHRLGGKALNFQADLKTGKISHYSKVSALALSLQSDLPYIKVKQKAVAFDSVTNDADFLSSDIVVVAVGSPSLNLHINKKIKDLNFKAAIFCWNEASGYGGHSVALDLEDICLECIYTNEYGFSMDHGLSLVTPGQEISKNLTGCAGVFTPFSYLDSSQTAAIAAKQCINMLSGKTRSNSMSWKGEDRYGLKVTDRFNTMPLKEEIDLIKAKKCRVCNEG